MIVKEEKISKINEGRRGSNIVEDATNLRVVVHDMVDNMVDDTWDVSGESLDGAV
jgi:hypothetical protein